MNFWNRSPWISYWDIHDAGSKILHCTPRQWLHVGQICCFCLLSPSDLSSLNLQNIHTTVAMWNHPKNEGVCFVSISLFVEQWISYFGKLKNSNYLESKILLRCLVVVVSIPQYIVAISLSHRMIDSDCLKTNKQKQNQRTQKTQTQTQYESNKYYCLFLVLLRVFAKHFLNGIVATPSGLSKLKFI